MNKQKRKIKRSLNKTIRYLNKVIYNDELWKGRFEAHLKERYICQYDDGYGYYCFYKIRFYDKQTKLFRDEVLKQNFFTSSDIFASMNDFIIKDVDVWKEKPTRESTIDYRGR